MIRQAKDEAGRPGAVSITRVSIAACLTRTQSNSLSETKTSLTVNHCPSGLWLTCVCALLSPNVAIQRRTMDFDYFSLFYYWFDQLSDARPTYADIFVPPSWQCNLSLLGATDQRAGSTLSVRCHRWGYRLWRRRYHRSSCCVCQVCCVIMNRIHVSGKYLHPIQL